MQKFPKEIRLSREMGLLDATMIGVGAMIGAGIFVLIGIAAGVAGPALIIAFVLNGLVALLTAMSYAELGSCFHDAGGGYLWVKEGLPKWNGFLSGWMSWFAHAMACGLYALGFGAYFEHTLHEVGFTFPYWIFLSPQKLLAVIAAIVFAYINIRGASETGKIGNLVTIAKIVVLAVFIGFGIEMMFSKANWKDSFSPFMANGWSGVFKAMGLSFIAFQGFEVIAQSSEEIRNPRKNIPYAVFLSLLIVIPIYIMVAVTSLGAVNSGDMKSWDYLALHKELALVEVAGHFFIGGGIMILIGGIVSTMSALNATIYSSSRVAFAMGRDRNFPAYFSTVHSKNFTPHWAILISLVIIVFMVVLLPIEDVASAADIMFLLLFFQVNIAMIRLRKTRPDLDRGFVVPFYPYLSIAGIAMLLFLAVFMYNYSYKAWIVTAVWIGSGLLIYKFYAAKREVEHAKKIRALERIEKKQYKILVCLANPATFGSLAHIAFALAKKHNAEIIFLNIIEVHEGQQLFSGLDENNFVSPDLDMLEEMAFQADIQARSIIRVAHSISQGIIDTVSEDDCNFIVMGHHKATNFFDRLFYSAIDRVIQKMPLETAIIHGNLLPEKIKTILIPFGSSINTRLAMEIGPAISDYFKAKLKIAVVFEPNTPRTLKRERIRQMQYLIDENKISAEIVTIRARNILSGIIKLSRDADLVLMGGRTGEFLELLFLKSLTQEITERVPCPVLWVKEYEERLPIWKAVLSPSKRRISE